jgi:lysophospholipase L1-like esterase
MNTSGPMTRIRATMDGYQASLVFVDSSGNNLGYVLANGIPNGAHNFVLFNTEEPAVENTWAGPGLTFVGFQTDGTALPATPARNRSIEFVGDSITVGYGSTGHGPCPADSVTSDNSRTYDAYLVANFSANSSIIAWSGKGMYENCCDNGERMPQYFLQTLGAGQYTSDWDFNRFVPQAMVINLGTNDFGHDSGAAWEAAFVATYVQFMVNVTTIYYKSAPPAIFVAQGPMNNSPALYNCLQSVVTQAKAAGIKASFLDMRNLPTDGLVTSHIHTHAISNA